MTSKWTDALGTLVPCLQVPSSPSHLACQVHEDLRTPMTPTNYGGVPSDVTTGHVKMYKMELSIPPCLLLKSKDSFQFYGFRLA